MKADAEQGRGSPGRGEAAAGCLVWGGQMAVIVACIIVMSVTLKANGTMITPLLESTRMRIWVMASAFALLMAVGVLAGYYGRYRVTGRGLRAIWVQVVVVAAVIALVVFFHSAVPVPPGAHGVTPFVGP